MASIKTGPKVILIVLLVVLFVFGLRKAAELGWIPPPGVLKALLPEKAVLPDVKDAMVQNVEPVPLPASAPARVRSPLIRRPISDSNPPTPLISANRSP